MSGVARAHGAMIDPRPGASPEEAVEIRWAMGLGAEVRPASTAISSASPHDLQAMGGGPGDGGGTRHDRFGTRDREMP